MLKATFKEAIEEAHAGPSFSSAKGSSAVLDKLQKQVDTNISAIASQGVELDIRT